MSTRHRKSPCCGQRIQRFGGRRRRCSQCGRTWRIRRKKPGRKPRRITAALLRRTLGEKRPLVRQVRPAGLAVAGLRQRFRRTLAWWLEHSASRPVPPGQLVLMVDGVWFRFGKRIWTLYLMAVKPLGAPWAMFLDPVLLPGRECPRDWHTAVGTLPLPVSAQICALVSDGFRGSKGLARAHGWVHQRCHFHLLAQLHARRGGHKHLPTQLVREAIYRGIREALVTRETARLTQLGIRLHHLACQRDCPWRLRMFVHGFLRELETFRAYQRYPEFDLPTTTNVVESMAKRLRDQLRPLSTPGSLLRWATALIRLRPCLVCNGHKDQPN